MYQRAGTSSGGGGGSAPELLWSNSSLASSFNAQKINESSTGWVSGKYYADYDGFIIMTIDYAQLSDTRKRGAVFIIKDISQITNVSSANYSSSIPYWAGGSSIRPVALESDGISIGNCNGGATYCIPMYIWGVKGILTT